MWNIQYSVLPSSTSISLLLVLVTLWTVQRMFVNQQAPVFLWHFVQKVNCIINCAHSIYRTTNKSSACTTQFNNSKLPASYIHFHTNGIQYPARIDLRAKSAIPSRPPCVPCLCHRCEEWGVGGRGSKFTFECLYSREIHLPSTQWAPGSEIKSAAIVQ